MHPVLQKWKFYTELSTLNWNKEKASVVTTLMLQLKLTQNTEQSMVKKINTKYRRIHGNRHPKSGHKRKLYVLYFKKYSWNIYN